jgi:hypothetical protein
MNFLFKILQAILGLFIRRPVVIEADEQTEKDKSVQAVATRDTKEVEDEIAE